MPRGVARQEEPIDIFENDDLSRAQEALEAATELEEEGVNESASGRVELQEKGKDLSVNGEGGTERENLEEPEERSGEPAAIEPTDAHLKLRVRQTTRGHFDAFKLNLSAALRGVRLTDSDVGRAVFGWFLESLAARVVEHVRRESSQLKRPASDDAEGMAQFDEALRAIVRDAVSGE